MKKLSERVKYGRYYYLEYLLVGFLTELCLYITLICLKIHITEQGLLLHKGCSHFQICVTSFLNGPFQRNTIFAISQFYSTNSGQALLFGKLEMQLNVIAFIQSRFSF